MTSHVLQEGAPEDVGMDPARIQRLRELVGGWVKNGETPSAAVFVARRVLSCCTKLLACFATATPRGR